MSLYVSMFLWGDFIDPAAAALLLGLSPRHAEFKEELRGRNGGQYRYAKTGLMHYNTEDAVDSISVKTILHSYFASLVTVL